MAAFKSGTNDLNFMNIQARIKEIAIIMALSEGPFTKKMIASGLSKMHPGLSRQEIMMDISCAIMEDKNSKSPLFRHVQPGWWDLAQKNNPSA